MLLEALILNHFDPERHIQIEIDALDYAISRILNQLISDNLGQWHLIVFFCKKMIPAKTRYETYDKKRSVIIKVFKHWKHYLKGCKPQVLMLTDHNNLQRFMDTKNLGFKQVIWA